MSSPRHKPEPRRKRRCAHTKLRTREIGHTSTEAPKADSSGCPPLDTNRNHEESAVGAHEDHEDGRPTYQALRHRRRTARDVLPSTQTGTTKKAPVAHTKTTKNADPHTTH